MTKSKFKKVTSLLLAAVLCVTTFAGMGTAALAAETGEKAEVYMVDYPRDGDVNYYATWGHDSLTYANGWSSGTASYMNLKAINSYSGNIAYCIEPGVSLSNGQSMTGHDEDYFNNLSSNGVLSGDEIRLFIGRILEYGYTGTISTSWRSQNESDANCMAEAYATQILIWETIVGERDESFNHKTYGETIPNGTDFEEELASDMFMADLRDALAEWKPWANELLDYYLAGKRTQCSEILSKKYGLTLRAIQKRKIKLDEFIKKYLRNSQI